MHVREELTNKPNKPNAMKIIGLWGRKKKMEQVWNPNVFILYPNLDLKHGTSNIKVMGLILIE